MVLVTNFGAKSAKLSYPIFIHPSSTQKLVGLGPYPNVDRYATNGNNSWLLLHRLKIW